MDSIIDEILTKHEKQVALNILDCLRNNNMMAEGLEIIARRFGLRLKTLATWYYSQRK